MSISAKLLLNLIILLLMVSAVSAIGFMGMNFVKSKLNELTERSTPYQTRTLELQRAIQSVSTGLMKVSVSTNLKELEENMKEVLASLEEVKNSQERLSKLIGERMGLYEELKEMAENINNITKERLKSEEEVEKANQLIVQRLKEVSNRLSEVDSKIKSLQMSRFALIASSTFDPKVFYHLKNLESLKVSLQEVAFAFKDIMQVKDKRSFLLLRAKLNSNLNRALQNEYLKKNKNIGNDFKVLAERLDEFFKVFLSYLEKPDGANTNNLSMLHKEIGERIASLQLKLEQVTEQESALAEERYKSETQQQNEALVQADLATNLLALNSELLSLGSAVEAQIMRIFTVDSVEKIAPIESELRKIFDRIDKLVKRMEKQLSKLKAEEELRILRAAYSSIGAVKGLLFAKDGVIAKSKHHLMMDEKAQEIMGRLRELVKKQAEKAKENVSTAQVQQEKSIIEVNRVIKEAKFWIVLIGVSGCLLGLLFGAWIFWSISKPLKTMMKEIEEISQGNLTCVTKAFGRDEVGRVRKAMCKMVENLSDVVGRLQKITQDIIRYSEELSSTANVIDLNSNLQFMQIDQTVSAITEMTYTIQDVAKNTEKTAESATQMREFALKTKMVMLEAIEELKRFTEDVRSSADSVYSLREKSTEINQVIDLIKKIADQTKLLALNAGIEAARAGQYGKGFAVVAENIKELASRTVQATDMIAKTVESVQEDITGAVDRMGDVRSSIDKIITEVNALIDIIDEIIRHVEEVANMVQNISTAIKEQSTAATMISQSAEEISQATKELREPIEKINGISADFLRLAEELEKMASWFKV